MGGMVGADVGALRDLAARFQTAATRLDATGAELSRSLHASPWSGTDAESFVADWDHNHRRLLVGCAQYLRSGAEALTANALQQEAASRADTLGSPDLVSAMVAGTLADAADVFDGWGEDEEIRDALRDQIDADELEGLDRTEVIDALIDIDGRLPWGTDSPRAHSIADGIDQASSTELAIVGDLMAAGMSEGELTEFLKGGHVWVADEGLYDRWNDLPDIRDRHFGSSHYKGEMSDQQIVVNGKLVGHALIGRARGGTWIQLERYADLDPIDHLETFGIGKGTGLNVGPWGGSRHNDDHPIELGGTRGPKGS